MLSANLFKLAGMPVQEAAAAQLRVNGLNPAVSGQGVCTFSQSITHGALARTEALGADWAANHSPADPDGNLYRVDDHIAGNSGVSNRFKYPDTTDPDRYDDIYVKQTNADLNDFTDLADLFRALNTTTNSAAFLAGVRARANLDQWIDYLVLDSLVGNMEGGLLRRTDDFCMYRGVLDPRFVLISHDFDSTLGLNGASGLNRTLFSYVDNSNWWLGGRIDPAVFRPRVPAPLLRPHSRPVRQPLHQRPHGSPDRPNADRLGARRHHHRHQDLRGQPASQCPEPNSPGERLPAIGHHHRHQRAG